MQLGIKDAARLLDVPENTVYLWIEEGRLPAYRVHSQYRFNRAELLEWATAQRLKVSPDFYREVEPGLPCLWSALAAGGVHPPLAAAGKAEALTAAVGLMRLPPEVDRAFLLEMFLAREAHSGSGVGEGIAMPHVRNPLVLPVERPMVSLCYLEPPVDFGAPDRVPVRVLFAIVSTGIRGHLHLLSRLAGVLREPSCRQLLDRRAGEAELVAGFRRVEEALTGTGA
ncbi:MAG: PTS sugar transporter subunit IIA [Elusimicrobia bacterium]|nr:PTS sugar transporter subunit IIA [Elusimicrobiota bacterium]